VASNQSEMLLALNKIDHSIVEKEKYVKESSDILEKLRTQFKKKSAILESVEVQLESATQTHASEETKLKEEEVKIVERRKQLTSLGGAKSAKLVERELDIAKRIMETLEQDVFSAIEKMESLASRRNLLVTDLDEVKEKLDAHEASHAELAETANGEIESLKKEKKSLIVTLDARLQNLYKRVESRYRGDAIALAESGSCRSCFRSLPAQTFNQVMAGYNLIQCPGCSRILVYVASEETASA
jgi:predicted  nucleic acid-binding Zn-ribbon protein